MPIRGERVRLLLCIPYRVCTGRGGVLEACARSAASSSAGKLLPLFTARLRIPRQAIGLKENLCGGFGSKMSDKKQTAASLGHSEELRVQNSPCETIPEFIHFPEQLSESPPIFARERSWDVFP